MTQALDAANLEPLLSVARDDPDLGVRIAALDAASRFPMTEEGWQAFSGAIHGPIFSPPEGSEERRTALRLAVRVPLLSVRRHLRDMTADRHHPDRDALAEALSRAGDASQVEWLLGEIRSGRGAALEILAAMPLEDAGVAAVRIPPPAADSDPDARLWYALAVARLGDFVTLDDFLQGAEPEPPIFFGDPWTPYQRIAAMRPVSPRMRDHLLDMLPSVDRHPNPDVARVGRIIVWAATGVADAEGAPPAEVASATPARGGAPGEERVTEATALSARLPQVLFDDTLTDAQRDKLAFLPAGRVAPLVREMVAKANVRARRLPPGEPANIVLGNPILDLVGALPAAPDWPVADLVTMQIGVGPTVLDDSQMAWVIARADPGRVVRELASELTLERPAAERRYILDLAGAAADHYAGRGGSPMRGAGASGRTLPVGRGPLIDDEPRAAMVEPPSPAEPAAERARGFREVAEERRVHAQIRHEGRLRKTFVAGADNLIRCWIGLPESERAAVADAQIPAVEIPREGLELVAELLWNDQSDRKRLLLPADRTARTGDCDLHIHVPEGERFVSAEVAFRYRGHAFEVVRIEAFALAPDEAEEPHQELRVRVQMRRRAVIELADRQEADATVIWGSDPPGAPGAGNQAGAALRVFGGEGAARYDLSDADAAVNWLNAELFAAETTLVRRRGRAAQPNAEPMLDSGDPEVIRILRTLARHGATLYNQLVAQGFADPGERIELLNQEPKEYVPIEFVYDGGYPADGATVCEEGLSAMAADEDACPVCKPAAELTAEERDRTAAICPFGFWSLQKIIERLDPDPAEDSEIRLSAPGAGRRRLPAIDQIVYGCSHRVPEDERETTWQALQEQFEHPVRAGDWGQWKRALRDYPPLLLALPHHDLEDNLDYLEIGAEQTPQEDRRLSRGQLTDLYVNPDRIEPGPIVLLLGCRTGARTEVGYVRLARSFQQLHTSIVLGTLAKVLGRHAAPVARELVSQLVTVDDPEADFGTLMRRVRRRMLAKGYLMALCLVALGDGEWRLTPRPRPGGPR